MPKYNTKPIDFTGCHPAIAKSLKCGEAIECWVWDEIGERKRKFIIAFVTGAMYPYKTLIESFKKVEPIEPKTKILKPLVECLRLLIEDGWKFDTAGSIWSEGTTIRVAVLQAYQGTDYCPDNSYPDYLYEEAP